MKTEIWYILKTGIIKFTTKIDIEVKREVKVVDWSVEAATKEGFDHFMLKEIYEQPKAIRETFLRRLSEDNELVLDGLETFFESDLKSLINVI